MSNKKGGKNKKIQKKPKSWKKKVALLYLREFAKAEDPKSTTEYAFDRFMAFTIMLIPSRFVSRSVFSSEENMSRSKNIKNEFKMQNRKLEEKSDLYYYLPNWLALLKYNLPALNHLHYYCLIKVLADV